MADLPNKSIFTGREPNAPIEVSSEATLIVLLSRKCTLESTCDDLATALDAIEAGDRSDVGRPASPLFLQERETSANPFGASVCHSHSGTEKEIARNHNKRKSSRDSGIAHGSQSEGGKRFCLDKEIFILSSRGKLIKPSEKNAQLKHNYINHSLNWTDENRRCRVPTELFLHLASSFNPRGWNFIKRIN